MSQSKPDFYVGWVTTTLCVLAAAVTYSISTVSDDPPDVRGMTPATVGRITPAFSLVSEDGRLFRLSSFQGRPVLLFFLCGCRPCQQVAKALNNLQLHGLKSIAVLGITEIGPGDAHSFRERTGFSFPVLLDSDGRVARTCGVANCPALRLLDERGSVRVTTSLGQPNAQECLRILAHLNRAVEAF